MKPKLKRLADQVIVVTGASSGIGLTTAELGAERGAAVVLAARSEEALAAAVDRIRARGGRAAAVVADVSEPGEVEEIGRRALAHFGRIDTWVNNAGISTYGALTEVPLDDKRRLFDVTFWGVVHGCEAAIPHLQRRGGAIINVGSVLSDFSAPLQGIYSAAKHAVKGYTDALRMELEEARLPIQVTLIKPGAIDTPYTQHARNYLARQPRHPRPTYAPEAVADAILRCAARRTREVVVGGVPRLQIAMQTIAPRLVDRYMERVMRRAQLSEAPPYSEDSLYEPSGEDYRRRSREGGRVMKSSTYTRVVLSDAMRAAPIVAAGAALAVVAFARRS